MLKQFTRSFLATVALTAAIACSSALAAQPLRAATARAQQASSAKHRSSSSARHKKGPAASSGLLGDGAVESQYDSLAPGQAEAFRLRAGASGVAHVVHVYISSANTASAVIVGLYSNANGRPGSLLSTGSGPASQAGTWTAVDVRTVALVSGRTYWLAVLGKGGVLRYRDRWHGSCPSVTSAQSALAALPARWRTGASYSNCPVSAYVTAVTPEPSASTTLTGFLEAAPAASASVSATAVEQPVSLPTPAPVDSPPPINTAPPIVTGTASEGQVLSASSGSWSGSPTSFAYQWQDCNALGEACLDVSGATATNYTLTSNDVGQTVRVVVTAENEGGSERADSAVTEVVTFSAPTAPVNSELPAITGSEVEGATLSASTGTWSGGPKAFAYQWQDCNSVGGGCVNVSGATASGYTLLASDVGHTMRVVVSASNDVGSAVASSTATAVVVPVPPNNVVAPAISGSVLEGETLTATAGTWSGSPTSFAYQWQDCNALGEGCLDVAGASGSSYKLAAGDVGGTLRVVVTATNAGGSVAASSPATEIVLPQAPTNSVPPTISGSPLEGATLTASTGTWLGSPSAFAYRWQDCNSVGGGCVNVSGATASSYVLAASDVGHTLRVVVTATNAGGSTAVSSAASVVVVPLAPVNTALPSVSGSAAEGETLSVSNGTWSGSPTSFAYQWQDCNTAGEGCSNVGGATSASYKAAESDVGHTLRVVVTASNAGGSGSVSSPATATVLPHAPTNTAPPSIGGTAVEGQTLTASTGTWSGSPSAFAYRWQDCNSVGGGCVNVSGATASSYKLAASDLGHTLRVVVTATNAGGSMAASSAASAVVVPPAPVNAVLPAVSGSAVEGQTLSASTGTWSGSPTSYAYQWQDCNSSGVGCVNVNGATASSYKLAASDVGHTLRVLVTATNTGGSMAASSAASAVVVPPAPVNTVLPSVSGSAVEGQTLTASTGTWSGSPASFAYQWQDCNSSGSGCVNVNGATSSSHTLQAAEVGHTIRVVVTATNAGSSTPASSAATGAVVPPAPANKALPAVSGTAVEGQTLTASSGTWSGSPTSYAYQWQDCSSSGVGCVNISGATASSYKLAASDLGHTLRVVVTATNAGGSTSVSSTATATVVPPAPTNSSSPSVSGQAVEGEVLSASAGTWSGNPTSFAYQWQDCNGSGEACLNVSGSTGASYVLSAGDVGHTVRVVVTATNAGGSTAASSAPTATVIAASLPPAAPTNAEPPSIAGSAVEGQVLNASTGAWAGSPTSFAYQWQDCNALGEACLDVSGATAANYELSASDVGGTVRVVVTASNEQGSNSASSTTTATVAVRPPAAPTNTLAPSVSGSAVEGATLTASSGTWTGAPIVYAYQWQDCNPSGEGCLDIGGATNVTYALAASDVGYTIRVLVTVTNAGGSASASSAATAVAVPLAPRNSVPPSISGTAVEGQTLSATSGVWSGSTTSLEYQWQDCDALGEGCLNIAGATASSYVLAASDVGSTVRVVVTASNAGGSTLASSAATTTVVPLPPTNTVAPGVTGSTVEGDTLSASTGTWSGTPTSYAYQWQDCNTAGESCSSVGGATASSYKLAASDVGHTLRVVVTATNAGGSSAASSAATGAIVPPAPVNTVSPSVSGSAVEGQTLSATSGSWSGSPTSFAYQWEDCNSSGAGCVSVSGAMGVTYKLAASDVGHTVRVVVTATNAGGSTPASSAASVVVLPPAPVNTVLPSVTGSAVEGQALSASTGTWSGSPTSYAYQWEDCNSSGSGCVNVSGATGSTYELAAGDLGHTLRVAVTATNAGGSTPASSAATGTVVPPALVNTVLPSVSGSAVEGDTLSASTGTWSGTPTSYAYQWQSCNTSGEACSAISGATASSYKLVAGNVGHTIRVVVTATNAGGSTAVSSAASAVVIQPAPVNTVLPSVSGSVVEGQTLTASTGAWSNTPTSYAYQWQDCNTAGESCSAISGATASSYKLAAIDVAHKVRVVVTATNAGGSTAASSAATGTVLPLAPVNTVLPSVSGSAVEGGTLSASTGTWSGTPTSYVYQWQSCNTSGEACSAISGATASSYKLVVGNVGHTIRVVVTATNAGGSTAASSVATSSVTAAESGGTLVGNTTIQASGDTSSAGTAEAFEYTATGGGTVQSISLYVNAGDSATSIVVGLYSNVSGHPGTLLTSATIAAPAAAAWHTVAVSPVAVSSGTIYWLAALAPSGTLALRDVASGGGPTQSSSSGTLKELPASWASGASWANSPASFYASAEAAPAPSAPANTAPPLISGSVVEGETLTASSGSWSNSPTSFSYQWQDCNTSGASCVNVNGATASSYKLSSGDVGHTVRAVVTATNTGGSGAASSAATATVTAAPQPSAPANLTLPSISGSALVGQTLSANNGTWTQSPTSYTYHWQLCASGKCSSITGATAASYVLISSDSGDTVEVVVTATNAIGSTAATSAQTASVGVGGSCKSTFGPSSSWSSVTAALAVSGATVCLSEGSYPEETIGDVAPASASTLTAAPGAKVTIAGININNAGAQNIIIENMTMTNDIRITHGSHITIDHNVWPGGNTGAIDLLGEGTGVSYVTAEYNRMEHLECSTNCGGATAIGECGTFIGEVEHIVFSNNVCGPYISGHYTQDGGFRYLTEEHNTFLGPSARYLTKVAGSTEGYHQNILQIFHAAEYVTFSNNVMRNTGANGNTILVENTYNSKYPEASPAHFDHLTFENNLFERADDGQGPGFCPTENLIYRNNTQIFSLPEGNFAAAAFSNKGKETENDGCASGAKDAVEKNLLVEIPCTRSVPGFVAGGGLTEVTISPCPTTGTTLLAWDAGTGTEGPFCSTECTVEDNATSDASADSGGSKHYVTNWKPSGSQHWSSLFANTKEGAYGLESEDWAPVGLSIEAGYKGGGGAPANTGPQN